MGHLDHPREGLGRAEGQPSHLTQPVLVKCLHAHAETEVASGHLFGQDVHQQGLALDEVGRHAFQRYFRAGQVKGGGEPAAELAKRPGGRQVGGAAAEVQPGDAAAVKGRLPGDPIVDLPHDVLDNFAGPAGVKGFVGEGAEATAGHRGIAERVREDAHQQSPAAGGAIDDFGGIVGAAGTHRGRQRVAVQQTMALRFLHPVVQHRGVVPKDGDARPQCERESSRVITSNISKG